MFPTYTVLLRQPDYIGGETVIVYAEAVSPEDAFKMAAERAAGIDDAKVEDYALVAAFTGRQEQLALEGHGALQTLDVHMGCLDRNTILAALRYWQAYLETGEAPAGSQLQMIHDIAEDGSYAAGPEHIDRICEAINS